MYSPDGTGIPGGEGYGSNLNLSQAARRSVSHFGSATASNSKVNFLYGHPTDPMGPVSLFAAGLRVQVNGCTRLNRPNDVMAATALNGTVVTIRRLVPSHRLPTWQKELFLKEMMYHASLAHKFGLSLNMRLLVDVTGLSNEDPVAFKVGLAEFLKPPPPDKRFTPVGDLKTERERRTFYDPAHKNGNKTLIALHR